MAELQGYEGHSAIQTDYRAEYMVLEPEARCEDQYKPDDRVRVVSVCCMTLLNHSHNFAIQ